MKRILVLGAGPAQLGLLEAAHRRRLYVVCVDRNPAAVGFRFADRRALVSVEDEPAVDRLAAAENVDGVIAPGIDWPVAIAARLAERLGLRHPLDPGTAVLATSKLRQRERFAAAGVPQPRYEIVRDGEEPGIGFPCVVKPPDRQGQRGLTIVRDRAAFGAAVDSAIAESRTACALVEELVSGPEVTVNAFSVGGRFHPLTVTDRLLAEPPAFGVALAHAWPTGADAGAAAEAARAAADALGITDGPTYTQVRLAPDGPRVGELAARLGGGHDAELCRAALGVDLNGLALAAALGDEPGEIRPQPLPGGACVQFIVAPEGELRAVEGLDDALGREGIVWIRIYRSPGDRIGPLLRGADRAGAVLALGADRDDALARAAGAIERIRFEVASESFAR